MLTDDSKRFGWRKDRASPAAAAVGQLGVELVDPSPSHLLTHPASGTPTSTPSSYSTNNETSSQTKQDEAPDIERRMTFIYDLDSWNICALVATASESQAAALRDAFFKYLTFRSSIEASLSDGWPTFRLSLHLPYYAWRCSSNPKADPRHDRRNHPLRHHRDVSFLNCEGGKAFLYEAQISFVLAGIDEWRWVAYCFVDSYFDEDGENAAQYHKDVSDGSHTDPFEYGVADKHTEQASEFFLKVFRIRTKQIMQEWERVVRNVEASIRQHARVSLLRISIIWLRDFCKCPLVKTPQEQGRYSSLTRFQSHEKRPTESPGPSAADGVIEAYSDEIQKSLNWVGKALSVLTELSEVLDKTSDAWDNFRRFQVVKLQLLSSASRTGPSLSTIRTSFLRLELLKKTAEFMAKRCSTMKQEVSRRCRDPLRASLAVKDGNLTVALCTASIPTEPPRHGSRRSAAQVGRSK